MKMVLSALFMMALTIPAIAQNDISIDKKTQQTICSFHVKDAKITLVEKQNPQFSFENGDNITFYKTELSVIVEHKNKQPQKSVLDSLLYISKAYKTMRPCVLIDTSQGLIYIFSNSKSPDLDYGMDGYVYRSDLSFDIIKKEIIFKDFNAGWNSFFGGSFRGNPELWHYSAAGRLVILSKRRGDNQWTNDTVGNIDPKLVEDQYPTHKNVLFATLPNMDSMKFY